MSTFTNPLVPSHPNHPAVLWAAGPSHAVINAVVGSPKNPTLLAALDQCDPTVPTLFAALSRSLVAQVRQQAAGRLLVARTLHQLGRDCLVNALGPVLESAGDTKYPALCAAWLERHWPALPARRWRHL